MTSTAESPDEWITLDDAAYRFGVSRRTLERHRKQGVLPGVRIGRYLRIRAIDAEQALTGRSPLQIYRQQAESRRDVLVEDWCRRWRMLVAGTPRRLDALAWIDRLIDTHGKVQIGELTVGDVVDAADGIDLNHETKLFLDALSGLQPDLSMLETTRTMLQILVPSI